MTKLLPIVVLALILTACGKAEVKKVIEYKGPIREVENMEMFYSENDRIKIKMTAPMVYEFQNGDREFPKGLYVEFYTVEGQLESTLKANHAYFFNDDNKWRGRGNVEVKNVAKREQLNTEELFWKQKDQKIFTEKFVTIRQQEDVIYGTGLDAKQDLTDYVIAHPYGEIGINE